MNIVYLKNKKFVLNIIIAKYKLHYKHFRNTKTGLGKTWHTTKYTVYTYIYFEK